METRQLETSQAVRLPTFYLPHGGGSCFFMDWSRGPANPWDSMAAFLRGLIATLPERPRAVVVVAGDPALAARVCGRLESVGFATRRDDRRGLDHGVFIPLMLVLPDADIPIVELSLRADLDPEAHIRAKSICCP